MADVQPSDTFSPSADELLGNNQAFAASFGDGDLPGNPARQLAIVTCMDARMDILPLLGLGNGEAHVIRNAGGVVTDDVIRSLCLSQRFLGTREIVLVHHTDCGLQKVVETDLHEELIAEVGVKPTWSVEAFSDPHADVRQSINRLQITPFITHKDHIRGFVYDLATGLLDEVGAEA